MGCSMPKSSNRGKLLSSVDSLMKELFDLHVSLKFKPYSVEIAGWAPPGSEFRKTFKSGKATESREASNAPDKETTGIVVVQSTLETPLATPRLVKGRAAVGMNEAPGVSPSKVPRPPKRLGSNESLTDPAGLDVHVSKPSMSAVPEKTHEALTSGTSNFDLVILSFLS